VVLEFTGDTELGELLGHAYGALGRYCAEQLEEELVGQATERYGIVDRREFQRALSEQDFKVDDLGSVSALKRLSARAGGFRGLVVGTFTNRKGRELYLQCKLRDTDIGEVVDSAGGTAILSHAEWGMIGRSVRTRPQDFRPDVQAVQDWDKRAKGEVSHPLADPNFPYRVQIKVGGKECTPRFEGNDCIVQLSKGETYEIWVENRTSQLVLMRLLVDGLNTLPQKDTAKGAGTYAVAKRVNLGEARPWVLDPKDPDTPTPGIWAVRGFVTEIGEKGKLREFMVVDAQESLAARRKFTDQIGLITAAFYVYVDQLPKNVGTAAGQERQESILYHGKPLWCGNPLSIVNIHYTDEKGGK